MLENYIRELVARMMNPGAEPIKETVHTDTVQQVQIKTASVSFGESIVRHETEIADLRPDRVGTWLVAISHTAEEAKSIHKQVVAEINRHLGESDCDSDLDPTAL